MDDFMATTAAAGHTTELERLASNHAVFQDAMGGELVFAPVFNKDTTSTTTKSKIQILDSATADGTWIRSLRNLLPTDNDYEFTGTDVNSRLFPQNTSDTTYQTWSYHDAPPPTFLNSFDFVHQRLALAGAPPFTPLTVLRNVLACVKPGGYIQLVEISLDGVPEGPEGSGPVLNEVFGLMEAIFRAAGTVDVFLGAGLKRVLEEAGEEGKVLEGIQERRFRVSAGAMAKDEALGKKSIEGIAPAVAPLVAVAKGMGVEGLGLSEERLETLEARVRTELKERGGTYEMQVVWGRKVQEAAK